MKVELREWANWIGERWLLWMAIVWVALIVWGVSLAAAERKIYLAEEMECQAFGYDHVRYDGRAYCTGRNEDGSERWARLEVLRESPWD